MVEGVWNDTPLGMVTFNADHCMSLTATGLTICEYCSVVAAHNRLDQGEGTFIVDISLLGVPIVNGVVGELTALIGWFARLLNND